LIAVAAFAVLVMLERILFIAAVRTLTSPYPTEHVYFGDALLLWAVFNGLALAVLGPIIYAMKVTSAFTSTPHGGALRRQRWAGVLVFGLAGAVIGAALGFVVGLIIGYAVDPGSNPHNYDGFARFFMTIGGTVVGSVAGAVASFITGLVRIARRAGLKAAPDKLDGNLA
jgi:hypothetical protein